MFKNFDNKKPYFRSVALATILSGSGIFALGFVELLFNLFGQSEFSLPIIKMAAGLVVLSLGYIHLELEMTRTK